MVSLGMPQPQNQTAGLIGQYNPTAFDINPNAYVDPSGNGNGGANLNATLGTFQSGGYSAPITAATAAPVGAPNYNTGTAGQLGLAQTYQNMAAGNGPSAATVAAQQAGAQGLQGAESVLGSARGAGSPAAAQLAARNAQATTANTVAQNAVTGRTNEELGALGAAGGLYGNVAGQGLQSQAQNAQQNQFNAGQTNQINAGNQATNLAAGTTLLGAQEGQNANQLQANQNAQTLGSQNQLGLDQIQNNAYQASQANNDKLLGSALQGAGGIASMFL